MRRWTFLRPLLKRFDAVVAVLLAIGAAATAAPSPVATSGETPTSRG